VLQITLTGKQTRKSLCLEPNRKLFCFSSFDVASFYFWVSCNGKCVFSVQAFYIFKLK